MEVEFVARCVVWETCLVENESLLRALRPFLKVRVERGGSSGLDHVDRNNLKVFFEGPSKTKLSPTLERTIEKAMATIGFKFHCHVPGPNRLVFQHELSDSSTSSFVNKRPAIVRVETNRGIATRIWIPDRSQTEQIDQIVTEAMRRRNAYHRFRGDGEPFEWYLEKTKVK